MRNYSIRFYSIYGCTLVLRKTFQYSYIYRTCVRIDFNLSKHEASVIKMRIDSHGFECKTVTKNLLLGHRTY